MILSRRVALDGAQLDEVDSRILIQSVESSAGKENLQNVSLTGLTGGRVTGEHRDSLDVIVKFSINEKSYRKAERAEVLEKVNTWACMGGWLTVNYKENRTVRVIAAQLPAEGDIGNRGNQYAITFRAYGVPWWQEGDGSSLRMANASSFNGTIGCAGNRESWAEFEFLNTGNTVIGSLDLTIGADEMTFLDLQLAKRETLVVDHDDNGRRCVQRIRILSSGGVWRSALAKRRGAGELRVWPGSNEIAGSTDGTGTLTVRCRGRYA